MLNTDEKLLQLRLQFFLQVSAWLKCYFYSICMRNQKMSDRNQCPIW